METLCDGFKFTHLPAISLNWSSGLICGLGSLWDAHTAPINVNAVAAAANPQKTFSLVSYHVEQMTAIMVV